MKWVGTALSLTITLSTSVGAQAEGLVMVIGGTGNLERQSSATHFARHYGPGGVPILPAPQAEPGGEEQVMLAAANVSIPRPVIPRPEVLNAIDATALRYSSHRALRAANMSVTEWMAFFRANIEIESGYNPNAESHVGAYGLGQLMPGTADVLGVDRTNMHENLDGSARYLLMLLERFQSRELALAGYNAGPEAVARHGGIPPYQETQGHVVKVMAVYQRIIGD